MAVLEMPREKWTDERLDDLTKRIDVGFADTKAIIADTKAEIADTKAEMRAGFARIDGEIRELRRELNAMNRNMFAGFIAILAAIVGSNAFF